MLVPALLSVAVSAAIIPQRRPESYDMLRAQLGAYGHYAETSHIHVHTCAGVEAKVQPAAPSQHDASSAVAELRRISGLPVAMLAEVLGVSPKTVHNWQNGKTVSASNMRLLGQVLDAVRYVDRGEADLNKALLLTVGDGQHNLVELLKEKRFSDFRTLAGQGPGRISSDKFLVISRPVENAGEELFALSDADHEFEFSEKSDFKTIEYDLTDEEWTRG